MIRYLLTASIAILIFLAGCHSMRTPLGEGKVARPADIQPVVMAPRSIRPPAQPPDAERIELKDGNMPMVLFLPSGWIDATNRSRLAVHFHTADWLALNEHLRAGYRYPLVSIMLGSGSAKYQEPFKDPDRLPRIIKLVEAEGTRRNLQPVHVNTIDLSSFSAGYGAVRELVQQPYAFNRIRAIVLSDSLYGGLTDGTRDNGLRWVQSNHVQCWVPFARAAVQGQKTFVLTYSEITPSSYASTGECAEAILAALGLKSNQVSPGTTPAAAEPSFPLRLRADAKRLHFWGYAGVNTEAHMIHPRHLADVWRAVDAEHGK